MNVLTLMASTKTKATEVRSLVRLCENKIIQYIQHHGFRQSLKIMISQNIEMNHRLSVQMTILISKYIETTMLVSLSSPKTNTNAITFSLPLQNRSPDQNTITTREACDASDILAQMGGWEEALDMGLRHDPQKILTALHVEPETQKLFTGYKNIFPRHAIKGAQKVRDTVNTNSKLYLRQERRRRHSIQLDRNRLWEERSDTNNNPKAPKSPLKSALKTPNNSQMQCKINGMFYYGEAIPLQYHQQSQPIEECPVKIPKKPNQPSDIVLGNFFQNL